VAPRGMTLKLVRDGRSVAELMDLGRTMLGRRQVVAGVPELVTEIQVDGTFPDGTKLVMVHHLIVAEHGELELAPSHATTWLTRMSRRGRYRAASGDLHRGRFARSRELS
jgi:urease gamma subunit-like protein